MNFNFRIVRLKRTDLEKLRDNGEKTEIALVGMVYADEDVGPELIEATVSKTKIYGNIFGRADTKAALLKVSAI